MLLQYVMIVVYGRFSVTPSGGTAKAVRFFSHHNKFAVPLLNVTASGNSVTNFEKSSILSLESNALNQIVYCVLQSILSSDKEKTEYCPKHLNDFQLAISEIYPSYP